ncbi:hypothetical protein PVL29_026345 [Vitis rotundifolia]|uniref:AAA+ ATPase domain-containing protein n=1 Tax=Vitis rotundifolia TaxID=103349 RepID=A0AA38YM72_VITRO|nr:hypothetical protein PVL29_026345 [Vitis rotundifolia]
MDFVSPVLDVASLICNCVGHRAVKVRRLPQNLNSLRSAMEELKNLYEDVKERVEREESLEKKRTHVVDGWIQRAEATEKEVNELLAKCDEEIQKKCLGTCCPRNCRATYKLTKIVQEKMDAVAALQTEVNNFQEVAVPLRCSQVIEMPLEKPVGLDSPFHEVWRLLQDEQVGTIGIYGVGGVGKTTLLKKINNKFLTPNNNFDIVILVVISKPTNLQKIQETLLSRLQIPDDRWKNRSEDEMAAEIYRVLKTKKFVLLLDDIWEPFNLLQVGIPPLNDRIKKSKIVFTTRSADVCGYMEAQKSIKVECLEEAEALSLFQAKVGEDTLNSHPDMPKLSEIVAKECKGLPLALVVIARAMARAKTPEEWERKMQRLREYPDKVLGMENDLFRVLAFSYDSLPNEAIKSCFLYCSLLPEDYEIPSRDLIGLWIGEGFLDDCDRIQGQEIIESLKDACLLENGTPPFIEEEYLKMHDVIHDMAMWLACEKGKKKNKFVVEYRVELIRAHEVKEWRNTQRISLWGSSIEELREPPYFPNTETFLASHQSIESFPNGFFTNMPVIRVLDLSNNNRLMELPVGNLVTLQYLNLLHTSIEYLPVELKNLKKLRCLILNYMYSLKSLPSQMVLSLSSLQLFGIQSSPPEGDQIALLKELEQLEHINDISIFLTRVLSTKILFNSHKLQRSTRWLVLCGCKGMNLVQLFPCVQNLELNFCLELEDVKIIFEKEVAPSKFPRQQHLNHLHSVHICECQKLLNLNWLIHAPKLQFLNVEDCIMEKVIEDEKSEVSEIEQDSSSAKSKEYMWMSLPFPSLRYISVVSCPNLKKLPFDSNTVMSKKLEKIEGEQKWWADLEWEDQTIVHNLTPIFSDPYTKLISRA